MIPAAPVDVAAPPIGAVATPSGVSFVILGQGHNVDRPSEDDDRVTFHYSCWTRDGRFIASTRIEGAPKTDSIRRLARGVGEVLRTMRVGEKRRTWIPGPLIRGRPNEAGPPGFAEDVTLDLELLAFVKTPQRPDSLQGPTEEATRTPSGLAYVVLSPGNGVPRPREISHVVVSYSGWTPEGLLFDTTALMGHPVRFGMREIIAGWREALQDMAVGERRRLWVPGALAYGERRGPYSGRGAPKGPLIYDLQLLSVER